MRRYDRDRRTIRIKSEVSKISVESKQTIREVEQTRLEKLGNTLSGLGSGGAVSAHCTPQTETFQVMSHPISGQAETFGEILINDTLRDSQKGLVFKRFSHFSRTLNVAFSRHFALSRAVGCPSIARTRP
jgi:hypothetical protein